METPNLIRPYRRTHAERESEYFALYRHFHPQYPFDHNSYNRKFATIVLPNKRLAGNIEMGDIVLLRLVLSGKTLHAVVTNSDLITENEVDDNSLNSNKPGYYIRAYGNIGGNRNDKVLIRIADMNFLAPNNVIIIRKLSGGNSVDETGSGYPASINTVPFQEAEQEDFIEVNDYESDSSIPDLISRDTTLASETLYLAIDLGLKKECVRKKPPEYKCVESLKFDVEAKTGVFIPATFTAQPQVDLLIYLHGHKSGSVSHGHDLPIDSVWDASKRPKFAFRELLNASGRNLILVAPTLGPLSQPGNLTSSDGFTSFISKVLAALPSYSSKYLGQQTPSVRSIILAAHSGGGEPMRRIAKLTGTNAYADLIKECWGFDCTYSYNDPPEWYNWAKTNPNKLLYLFSIPGTSTARNAALIQSKNTTLPNINVKASSTGDHNSVPKVYMAERLSATTAITENYDDSYNDEGGCDCEEDYGEFDTESFEDDFTEQSATAASSTSESPMLLHNIPFAPIPATGSYWPLRTKKGRVVSYLSINNKPFGGKGRRFLAMRENRSYNGLITKYKGTKQNRWHVGIDLFANVGDKVLACEEGKIINLQYFYKAKSGQRTYGILVEHAGCMINYGEVTGDSLTKNNLREGDNVVAGQVIGFVSDTSMLHFETYALREDHQYHNLQWWMLPETPTPPVGLLNPTQYLLHLWKNGLPAVQGAAEMISDVENFGRLYAFNSDVESETTDFISLSDEFSINNSEEQPNHSQLRLGAQGDEVKYLQQRLNYHDGNGILKDDGAFGPKTRQAVLIFQQIKGLAADGIVGPKTWVALDADRNGDPDSNPPVIPPIMPGDTPVEQVEWTINPNINAHYKNWQLYRAVREEVSRWRVADPAAYIETALKEWNTNTGVQRHFDSNFEGNPHRSYLNLKRLYQAKGISDPASYFNTNIVPIKLFNRSTQGHLDLQKVLNTAQDNLKASGNTYILDAGTWSFVPRTFNDNINRLSNHALGKAIDINPANNPHITSKDEVLVIDAVCNVILTNGLLKEANPSILTNASIHFQNTFNDAWVAQQTESSLVSAIRKSRTRLNSYADHGFLNLPVTLITALQNAGLSWGGSWKSAKDFMHFELPNA